MTTKRLTLPGAPGKALSALWGRLETIQQEALLPHLLGDTSAQWLAETLTTKGHPIGRTTIKDYRRALREQGVQL